MMGVGRDGKRAFTLIEVVLVITIIGLMSTLLGMRLGTFTYLREENFIRNLVERLAFLHRQAISDQAYYVVEFDLEEDSYRVGLMRAESDVNEGLSVENSGDVGTLTLELADFLNPAMGDAQTIIPPPSFPSLAEPQPLPANCSWKAVKTMRGKATKREGGKSYMIFSPRGFSEFSVLHLALSSGQVITIVVNPFTGEPEVLREEKEFEWTYGQGQKR